MKGKHKKIIISRRIWQLIITFVFVLMATFARYYPLGLHFGINLFIAIFLLVFGLIYNREERRATRLPDSNLVINWNLAEAVLLLSTALGFIVVSIMRRLDESFFYAYLRTFLLGLLSGVALGELFWQNTRLKELDESFCERYWANYKNSI